MNDSPRADRRQFLKGQLLRDAAAQARDQLADELLAARLPPTRGPVVLLQTTAMACHFEIVVNAADARPDGAAAGMDVVSTILERVHALEQIMTVYRPEGELAVLNQQAGGGPREVSPELFEVVRLAQELCRRTEGGFDPTTGPLIGIWRQARQEGRVPTEKELAGVLSLRDLEAIQLDPVHQTIQITRPGVSLNLGAIGKGYAVDCLAADLKAAGVESALFHGGKSSLRAFGRHGDLEGWPVGIGNPLFPEQTYATYLLQDRAMGVSGTAVQHFRVNGRRYGHILDGRTGWPAEELLSAVAFAPTAAEADALSTAFFVLGVEKTRMICDTSTDVSALLFPAPRHGRRLDPVAINLKDDRLFLHESPAGSVITG